MVATFHFELLAILVFWPPGVADCMAATLICDIIRGDHSFADDIVVATCYACVVLYKLFCFVKVTCQKPIMYCTNVGESKGTFFLPVSFWIGERGLKVSRCLLPLSPEVRHFGFLGAILDFGAPFWDSLRWWHFVSSMSSSGDDWRHLETFCFLDVFRRRLATFGSFSQSVHANLGSYVGGICISQSPFWFSCLVLHSRHFGCPGRHFGFTALARFAFERDLQTNLVSPFWIIFFISR